jgi:hypothetical protein
VCLETLFIVHYSTDLVVFCIDVVGFVLVDLVVSVRN